MLVKFCNTITLKHVQIKEVEMHYFTEQATEQPSKNSNKNTQHKMKRVTWYKRKMSIKD